MALTALSSASFSMNDLSVSATAAFSFGVALSLPAATEPSPHAGQFSGKPVPEEIEFNRDVRPVLSGNATEKQRMFSELWS